MQRRQFITMAAIGAAGLALPASSPGATATLASALASPRLLAVLGNRNMVRELGQRYRAQVPAEDDAGLLVQAILPERPCAVPALDRWLAGRIQQDFADGHTVTVHGWILSVTEARQCALYSLQSA